MRLENTKLATLHVQVLDIIKSTPSDNIAIMYKTILRYNNCCFPAILDTRKKCDDLEGWCVKMDKAKDCCSETVQTKCPGLCDTCPGMYCMKLPMLDQKCTIISY